MEHERGLRVLGLWPGPFDGVAAAPTRAEAAAELANVKALARAAKRQVARRNHPDMRRRGADLGAMTAAIDAADWVEARSLDELWSARPARPGPPPRRRTAGSVRRRAGSPIEIEVGVTGIRISVRGTL